MSRKNAETKKALRAFLAASSALVLLTAVSPLADASDKGKQNSNGDSHGKKADKSTVDSILNTIQSSPVFNGHGKKFENDGNALEGQTNSLLKKLDKLGSSNPAILSAINAYKSTVDTATATFQIAIKGAKNSYQSATAPAQATRNAAIDTAKAAYQSALAGATTEAAKQSAEDAFKSAVKAAGDTFDAASTAAAAVYKAAAAAAQLNFNTAIQAANLALKTALLAISTPTPGASPSPSPSPSST